MNFKCKKGIILLTLAAICTAFLFYGIYAFNTKEDTIAKNDSSTTSNKAESNSKIGKSEELTKTDDSTFSKKDEIYTSSEPNEDVSNTIENTNNGDIKEQVIVDKTSQSKNIIDNIVDIKTPIEGTINNNNSIEKPSIEDTTQNNDNNDNNNNSETVKPVPDTDIKNDESDDITEENKPISNIVEIKDKYLKKTINLALGKDGDSSEDITKDEMLTLTELCSDDLPLITTKKEEKCRGIADLSGLEYAKNLKVIKFSANEISDLSPIKDLTNLEFLEVYRNEISDLTPLKNLKNLEHLDIYNNAGIIDLSPISNLTKLKWIDMHYCNRRTAKVTAQHLSNLTEIEFLSIDDNYIDDLSFIKNMTKLKTFSCNNNYVTDFSLIAQLASDCFEDWSGERFLNTFGQRLHSPIKVTAPSDGMTYKFKSPLKGFEQYIEKIYDTYGVTEGLPEISYDESQNIALVYNETTNEFELTIPKNTNNVPQSTRFKAFLEIGMYSLTLEFDINQE
ncbi:MAG: leucine-rich repeat domain-containing protein [Clostridium sp.]|nr:leucine-rich repeat domain-containing protein [Clostridium sp.]